MEWKLCYLWDGSHQADLSVMPQLILLDLKLPKIDGLEVLRRIRAEPGPNFFLL
jgi:CheY-like chemotaxis protein